MYRHSKLTQENLISKIISYKIEVSKSPLLHTEMNTKQSTARQDLHCKKCKEVTEFIREHCSECGLPLDSDYHFVVAEALQESICER